jgi:glyoxylase-like metal-dependent hydrolase (beta-lactamase superfamily II)
VLTGRELHGEPHGLAGCEVLAERSVGSEGIYAPGHTPGSYILVVTSGEDSAYLLGDVVHSPLQLTNSGIAFATDADVALATRIRSPWGAG